MKLVKRVGRIGIASDNDVTGCLLKAGLVCSPVPFSGLDDDYGTFRGRNLPSLVLGIAIDDEDLEVPASLFELLTRDGIDGLTNTGLFVDGGDDDADLQE